MNGLNTEKLSLSLQEKITPFFHEILQSLAAQIDSIHLAGSVLTEDYRECSGKIDSVVVLKRMELAFLVVLAPLGRKYGQQGIAAPLIMDPAYIESSIDVFPLEFFNFQLLHQTIYGEDRFAGLSINRQELRYQCERELKGKLLWLHRIYVSAMGDGKILSRDIMRHFEGYVPLFRGIAHLLGQTPARGLKTLLDQVVGLTGRETGVFTELYAIKQNLSQPSKEEISALFGKFYGATARLVEVVDGLQS